MKHPVRFEGLGPPGIARRYGGAEDEAPDRLERARAVLTEASKAGPPPREVVLVKTPPPAPAPAAKVGRPAKGRPWEAEGISRALWYRRRKGGAVNAD